MAAAGSGASLTGPDFASIPPTHRRSVDKNRAIVTAARDLFFYCHFWVF